MTMQALAVVWSVVAPAMVAPAADPSKNPACAKLCEASTFGKLSPGCYGLSRDADPSVNSAAIRKALELADHVVIPGCGTYRIADVKVNAGKALEFVRGGILAPAPGSALRVSGTILAGPYQILESPAGEQPNAPLILTTGEVNTTQTAEIWAEWFGARGDGMNGHWESITEQTDNSIPLQQALWAASSVPDSAGPAPRLRLGPGRFDYSRSLVWSLPRQALYGAVLEGTVGTRSAHGANIGTSAMVGTGLHFNGTGTGLTIGGSDPGTPAALSFTIRHIWFSGTSKATDLAVMHMANSSIEHCIFSSNGAPSNGAPGYGLHLMGESNTIDRTSFNDLHNGLWMDRTTASSIRDAIFHSNRGAYSLLLSGTQNVKIEGSTFQDNESDAIGVDGETFGLVSTNTLIHGNYFEAHSGGGNRLVLRGRIGRDNLCEPVTNTRIIGNYFSKIGPKAEMYVSLDCTDGTLFENNSIPRGQAGHKGIWARGDREAVKTNRRPTGTTVVGNGASRDTISKKQPILDTLTFSAFNASGPTVATGDLNDTSMIVTNEGANGSSTSYMLGGYCFAGLRIRGMKTDDGEFRLVGLPNVIEMAGQDPAMALAAPEKGVATIELLGRRRPGDPDCSWVVAGSTGVWRGVVPSAVEIREVVGMGAGPESGPITRE